MSLQTKFVILLSLLAVTIALILGTAVSFGTFLQRELVWPYERTMLALRDLGDLKELSKSQKVWLLNRSDDLDRSQRFERYIAISPALRLSLEGITSDPEFQARVGVSTTQALILQADEMTESANAWFATGELASAEASLASHERVEDLIEMIELRLIREAPEATAYGSAMTEIHRTLVLSGVAAAVLFAVLCITLLRRWVIVPIRELREATERFGQGDLLHRVPIRAPDELGVLSAELNHMAEMISTMQNEAVERERLAAVGEMVRRLAHNIRNPLAAIRSLAELSKRRSSGDENLCRDQSEIIASVDRFNNWLTDLLGATSPVGIQPRIVAVRPWLDGVIDTLEPLARMRGIELIRELDETPAEAPFDPRHLEHALIAIVTNAIQASPGSSRVWFSVLAPTEQEWEIRIRDEGEGIPDKIRARIFKPYFTTKHDGTGIGLAIAQQVVKGHGGSIHVESERGKGSTFSVRIPIVFTAANDTVALNQSAVISQSGDRRGAHSGH